MNYYYLLIYFFVFRWFYDLFADMFVLFWELYTFAYIMIFFIMSQRNSRGKFLIKHIPTTALTSIFSKNVRVFINNQLVLPIFYWLVAYNNKVVSYPLKRFFYKKSVYHNFIEKDYMNILGLGFVLCDVVVLRMPLLYTTYSTFRNDHFQCRSSHHS